MKIKATLAVLALAASFIVLGQNTARAKDADAVKGITKLEDDWGAALVANNIAFIDSITCADFIYTDNEGATMTKAQFHEDMVSGSMKLTQFKIDDMKIRVFGDTAIVHGLETEKSSYKGADTSGQYRYTDVFVRKGGVWTAVTTHESKIPKN